MTHGASYTTTNPHNFGLSPSTQVANSLGCNTCVSAPVNNCPSSQYMAWVEQSTCEPSCTVETVNKKWIDEYLLDNFQYGYRIASDRTGLTELALIPQYLMQFCPPQTQANSRGNKMGEPFCITGETGTWQQYIKVIGTRAYQYIRNITTGEERQGGDWDFGIHDCAIVSLNADKLINYCNLFSKVAEPINNYFDQQTGSLAQGYRSLPLVISQIEPCNAGGGCKLSTLLKCQDVRACVFPALTTQKGLLWDYNAITDVATFKPENLDCLVNVCVDGTTIRPATPGQTPTNETKGGAGEKAGGKILTAYTYTDDINIKGDGTPLNPVALKCSNFGANIPGITNTNSLCEFLTLQNALILAETDPYIVDNAGAVTINANATATSDTGLYKDWSQDVTFATSRSVPRLAPAGYKWVLEITSHMNFSGASAAVNSGNTGFGIIVNGIAQTISTQDAQTITGFGGGIAPNGDSNVSGVFNVPQTGNFNITLRIGVRFASGDVSTKPVITFGEISYVGKFKLVRL
jgi:hypothetical protein